MESLSEPLLAPVHTSAQPYLLLLVTILLEVSGTILLRASVSDARAYAPAFLCYFTGLYLFSLSLRYVPLSVAYPTWCALGTVGVTVASAVLFKEDIGLTRWACIVLTVPPVVGMYVLP